VTDCVFCQRIANGEYEPCYGTRNVVRFEPLNPVTPGHMLFVPVQHVRDALQSPLWVGHAFEAAAQYARESRDDFNLITSAGRSATQTVWHLHIHYVPRYPDDGLHLPWTGQKR
jgi:histidine triad (HIT) family protein